jgi:hypothetical protein
MDPKTGELYGIDSEFEAKLRGLVPVPEEDVERVKAMSLEERVRWLHVEGKLRTTDPDELRKIKNKLKAERRALRGK